MVHPLKLVELQATIVKLMAEYPELANDEDLMLDTLEGETDFNEMLNTIHSNMQENDSIATAINIRIDGLNDRRNAVKNRYEFGRKLILKLMTTAGVRKVMLTEANISVVNSARQLIVEDEARIPNEYFKEVTTRSLMRAEVLKALKDGVQIDGATLSNGGEAIQIRS